MLFSSFQTAKAEDLLVPDDYITIEEAMEEAEFGDTVVVLPGTYNERVVIKEGVNLVSFAGDDGDQLVDGPGDKKVLKRAVRTIIDGTGITEPGYLVSFAKETTAPMRLDGFTIVNMPKYFSGINLFIMEIRGSSPVVVNNIISENRSWGGILSTGLGIGMGPELETVASPLIQHNVIFNNDGPGISNGANSGALIKDNEIFNNHFPEEGPIGQNAPCVGVREYARPIIDSNICYNNGVGVGGINLDSHDQPLIIRNNTIRNNTQAGIGLRAIGGVKTNVTTVIENNRVYENVNAGMRLIKVDAATIVFNKIHDNRRGGIVFSNVDEVIVEDNEIYGNLTTGIRILDVPKAQIRRNHIYNNATAGIDFLTWDR